MSEKLKEYIGMLNLHKAGKKVQALELLEDYLLRQNDRPRLSIKDIELIIKGFGGKKGLLLSIGGENHIRKSLKTSAFTALRLLVTLLESPQNRSDFLTVIGTVESIILEQMKLDKHFKSSESTGYDGVYKLCMAINQVKQSVPVDVYIKRQVYRDKFLAWLQQNTAPKTNDEKPAEPVTWSMVKPEVETIDPLGVKEMLNLPQVISIEHLDINSAHFKPEMFMNKVHQRITVPDLRKGLQNLKEKYTKDEQEFTLLISHNVHLFNECNGLLDDIKENFSGRGRSIAGTARDLLVQAEETENTILMPLVKNRTETDRVKRLMQLSNNYDYLFKLPTVMDTYLMHLEIDKIIELYKKHYKTLKDYSYLPVLSKLVVQIEEVIKKTRETIIKQLLKEKHYENKYIDKVISQLEALRQKENPINTLINALTEKFQGLVVSSWTQIDQNSEIPWLIGKSPSVVEVQSTDNTNFLLDKVLKKVYSFFEICTYLIENYPTKADKKKIYKSINETSANLIANMKTTIFGGDSSLLLAQPYFLSPLLYKFFSLLPVSEFIHFYHEFLSRLIKSEFKKLKSQVNELWKEEMWSKDYSNIHGTCLPRIFEVLTTEKLIELKEHVCVYNNDILEELGSGIGLTVIEFLTAMKSALNERSSQACTQSQKILMTISNSKYLNDLVIPALYNSILELFPGQYTLIAFEENSQKDVAEFIEGLINFYTGFKGDKYQELIEKNLSYTNESIGLETSFYYKFYVEKDESVSEIRTYTFSLLGNIVKVVNDLQIFCPSFQEEVLLKLTEEIIKIFRVFIHRFKKQFDVRSIYQLWVEIKFLKTVLRKFPVEGIEKIFYNLRKIYNSIVKRPRNERENSIFSKANEEKIEKMLSEHIRQTNLLFESLGSS